MPDARALKAVVCDYDSWNLRVLTASVVDAGYEVLGETTNAVETIRLAELLHPTLVVITQEQNGMSAIDALPALRAMESCFPGRDVVGVPGRVLAFGGGGVHNITNAIPAT